MPLYDYKCTSCDNIVEEIRTIDHRDDYTFCKKCGADMERKLTYPLSRDWFRPFWQEDFDIKPIYVESKSHYKKLCKEYKVQARCLL